jgi:hypothetical protein
VVELRSLRRLPPEEPEDVGQVVMGARQRLRGQALEHRRGQQFGLHQIFRDDAHLGSVNLHCLLSPGDHQ